MAPHDKSAGTIQIIVALIGLIGTVTVAYIGYRQNRDNTLDILHATQTAYASQNGQPLPPTNTEVVSGTSPTATVESTLTTTPTGTLPPTLELTSTPTPIISASCMSANIWHYTFTDAIPTDGCWRDVPHFFPLDDGIRMSWNTPLNSGEQQRGFYSLVGDTADIQFVVNLSAFNSQKLSGAGNKQPNISFGITEGSPFNDYNGIYVYFYSAKPGAGSNKVQIVRNSVVYFDGSANLGDNQTIRLKVENGTLTVYINGVNHFQGTAGFTKNAFYFGYRLFEETELNVSMTKLEMKP